MRGWFNDASSSPHLGFDVISKTPDRCMCASQKGNQRLSSNVAMSELEWRPPFPRIRSGVGLLHKSSI